MSWQPHLLLPALLLYWVVHGVGQRQVVEPKALAALRAGQLQVHSQAAQLDAASITGHSAFLFYSPAWTRWVLACSAMCCGKVCPTLFCRVDTRYLCIINCSCRVSLQVQLLNATSSCPASALQWRAFIPGGPPSQPYLNWQGVRTSTGLVASWGVSASLGPSLSSLPQAASPALILGQDGGGALTTQQLVALLAEPLGINGADPDTVTATASGLTQLDSMLGTMSTLQQQDGYGVAPPPRPPPQAATSPPPTAPPPASSPEAVPPPPQPPPDYPFYPDAVSSMCIRKHS
jgi:hypothetical protein